MSISALEIEIPYAVDVSSAIEKAPGRKDHNLMNAFIKKVRNVN